MLRRYFGVFALGLALSAAALGQNTATFGAITTAGAGCGSSNCVYYQLPTGTPWVVVTLSGSWTGTVNFVIVSAPNANYFNLNAIPWTTIASETGTGTWSLSTSGALFVLVQASALASGTVQVNMTASQNGAPMTNPVFPGGITATGLTAPGGGSASTCWTSNGGTGACAGVSFPTSTLFLGTNVSGSPVAATPANLASFLGGLPGCATTNFAYTPASGDCQSISGSGGMVYPGAGVAISTGSAWGASLPLAGAGVAIPTGPATSVSGDVVTFTGTAGQHADSGVLLGSLAPLASPTFSGTVTMPDGGTLTSTGWNPTGKLTTAASTTSAAMFNIPIGTAPTSPVNGDIWGVPYTAGFTGLYWRNSAGGNVEIAGVNFSNYFTYAQQWRSGGNAFYAAQGANGYVVGFNGNIFTGGTGASTVPYMICGNGATAVTTWSTSGTWFGCNAASGFAGNFLDFHVNGGASVFAVNSAGAVAAAGGLGVQVHGFGLDDSEDTATAYTSSQVIARWKMPAAGTIPATGSGTYNAVTGALNCELQTAATASTTFTLLYSATLGGTFTSFGTVVFGAGTKTAPTITITSAQSVASGGVVEIQAPATADTTAMGIICGVPYVY